MGAGIALRLVPGGAVGIGIVLKLAGEGGDEELNGETSVLVEVDVNVEGSLVGNRANILLFTGRAVERIGVCASTLSACRGNMFLRHMTISTPQLCVKQTKNSPGPRHFHILHLHPGSLPRQ